MIQINTKPLISGVILALAMLVVIPTPVKAFQAEQIIDPFCLFACDDGGSDQPTVSNSYNTNSFNTTSNTSVTTTNNNNSNGGTVVTPVYVPTTPVYVPTSQPVYNNYYNEDHYRYIPSNPVYIPTTPVYVNPAPVYNYNNYYTPLAVSCSANRTSAGLNSVVTWTAYATGGYRSDYFGYTYSWSGSENIYGSSSSVNTYYANSGVKYATVTIYNNGQSVSAQCANTVTVGVPVTTYYYANQYSYQNTYPVYNNTIQIACYADPATTRVGVPVTWSVEAYGQGYTNYTYAWTGSDGLSGNQSSIITTYTTPGTKSAVVTVTSPTGQSQSKACGNTINVKSAYIAKAQAPKPAAPAVVVVDHSRDTSAMSAASLFTLNNVPWGWVAILIILMLLGIIFYLAFNKKKI